jgi:hypothetical protein
MDAIELSRPKKILKIKRKMKDQYRIRYDINKVTDTKAEKDYELRLA